MEDEEEEEEGDRCLQGPPLWAEVRCPRHRALVRAGQDLAKLQPQGPWAQRGWRGPRAPCSRTWLYL